MTGAKHMIPAISGKVTTRNWDLKPGRVQHNSKVRSTGTFSRTPE
jgi:hypothetical protein